MKIVLASASPRRKRLLARLGRPFSVKMARIDEKIRSGEPFSRACVRLSELKAAKVAAKDKDAVVIGADTVACLGKRNFRKTENEKTAREALSFLSGKTHFVITGVCVIFPGGRRIKYTVKASVRMKKLGAKMIDGYLESGEWRGRAGSYDISGRGKRLVECVKGEKETVVGLPVRRLRRLLQR